MMLKNVHFYCFQAIILVLFACQKKEHTFTDSNYEKQKITALTKKAEFFIDKKKTDSAFYYYNEVKSICDPLTYPDTYVVTLNSMAVIQQNQNDFVGSKITLKEALPFLTLITNSKHIWDTYSVLGVNYLNTYQFRKAEKYFEKALELNIDEFTNIESQKNIAEVFIAENKHQEAIQILLLLIDKKEVNDNPKTHAEILDRIGYCYYLSGNSEAYAFLNDALQIRAQLKDPLEIAKSNYNLALFYENKNPLLAKKYMKTSYEKYILAKNVDGRLSALKLIMNNSQNTELKQHSIKYIDLVDSIYEVRQKAKNLFAKIKYNSKKEKEENLILKTNKAENELQLEKQKIRNIILYLIILLSLSLILVLYFFLTSKANKDKIEASYKIETKIAKKLHDELANDIYHTMAFAEHKNLSLAENKQQLLNSLDAIYSRTKDISKENNYKITDENYVSHLKKMISSFNTPFINIIINGLDSIFWEDIDQNKKKTIYRILQELLVNMKKHSNASVVGINFKTAKKDIIIHYYDNGKGVDNQDIIFKNGLHNIENQILHLKGEMQIDSAAGKGFKLTFKFSR